MPDLDDFLENDYDRVVRSVALACGSVDAAEDAVQGALVKALDSERRGKQIEHLAAWVFVVATNANRRRFRRVRTEQRSFDRLASARTEHADPGDERSFELWPAVRELPRRQRQAVVLFYIHDLDVRTIANLLAVSEGTIKTALHRGRATLRARLGTRSTTTPTTTTPTTTTATTTTTTPTTTTPTTTTPDKEDDHVR